VIAKRVIDLDGMVAANDERSPESFKFIEPGVIELFHLEREGVRDGVKEAKMMSELMSGGKQSVLREIRGKRSGLESQRRARIGHRITSI